jgi:hypothetical protein
MDVEPSHAKILAAVEGINVALEERRHMADIRRAEERVVMEDIDDRLSKLEAIANIGKGFMSASLKIGGLIAALSVAAWAVWEKFN